MGGINRVLEIGRITRDCEMKYLNTGTAICNFSIAVSEYMGSGKEDWSNYFDCVIFGKRAEGVSPYLLKGQQVGIDGTLHQNRWQKDGANRSKIQIKVNDLELIGSKPAVNHNEEQKQNRPTPAEVKADFEDDVPF